MASSCCLFYIRLILDPRSHRLMILNWAYVPVRHTSSHTHRYLTLANMLACTNTHVCNRPWRQFEEQGHGNKRYIVLVLILLYTYSHTTVDFIRNDRQQHTSTQRMRPVYNWWGNAVSRCWSDGWGENWHGVQSLSLSHNEAFTQRCSYWTLSLLKQPRRRAAYLLLEGGTFLGSARDLFFN